MKRQEVKSGPAKFSTVKSASVIFFAVLCLYFSFDLFSDPHAASRRYRLLTYPIFTVICLAWVFHVILFLIRKAPNIRVWKTGIILCVLTSLLLSAGIFRISPQKLRIFDDAPDRISTSIAFSKFHRCERLHAGFWKPDGSLTDTASSRTARSPFFAYLVSVIHSFTGYRIENIFLANWIVLNAILILASLSMLFFFGKTAAICTQLLILSQPLVLYVTESACYEGVGAVALMALLCASYRIISRGPGPHSASFVMLAAAVGIHCRPEMIALIALVFLITAGFSKSWLFTRASAVSGITLFLSVMPYIWHRISFKWSYPTMNIKGSGGLGVAAPTVSKYTDGFIQSFIKAFSLSAESFFKIADISAFNGLLNYIFLMAVLLYILLLLGGRVKTSKRTLAAVFSPAACIISYVLLISVIGWSADHPNTARYFIFLPIAVSMAVVAVFFSCLPAVKRKQIMLPVSAALLLCFLPNIVSPRFFLNSSLMSHYYHDTTAHLKRLAGPKSLIVSINSNYSLINGWSALDFNDFRKNRSKIIEDFREGAFDNIFVVQQMNKQFTKLWDSSDSIDDSLQTEILDQYIVGSSIGVQISKIIL